MFAAMNTHRTHAYSKYATRTNHFIIVISYTIMHLDCNKLCMRISFYSSSLYDSKTQLCASMGQLCTPETKLREPLAHFSPKLIHRRYA